MFHISRLIKDPHLDVLENQSIGRFGKTELLVYTL